jgi:hypothetical protein
MKRLSVEIGYCARVSVLENQESRSRIFNLFLGRVNVLRLGCNPDGTESLAGNPARKITPGDVGSKAPLFTDFTSSNLGVPRNPAIPYYNENKPDRYGNTRDKLPRCAHGSQGEKVMCWPAPEFPQNMDTTIGNLGLTDEQEDQIVAFLKTLTDGYKPQQALERK